MGGSHWVCLRLPCWTFKTVSLLQNRLRAQRNAKGYDARVNYSIWIHWIGENKCKPSKCYDGFLHSLIKFADNLIRLVSIGILCNYTHISYSIGVQIHHPSPSSFFKTCILSPWQHSFLFVIFFADRCRILAPLEPFLNAAARQLRWRIEAWIGRLSGCLGLVGFVGSDSSFQMRSIALRHSCHNQAVCVSAMFIEVLRAKYILTKNHRTTATVSWNINFTMRWWKNRNHLGTNFHFLPNQPDEQVCTHTHRHTLFP